MNVIELRSSCAAPQQLAILAQARPRGVAPQEGERKAHAPVLGLRLVSDQPQKNPRPCPPHLMERLLERGEGRLDVICKFDAIEPDDGNILGNPDARGP